MDILEGEDSGQFTVTVTGPFDGGEWTWTGYADNSVAALATAQSARAEMFERQAADGDPGGGFVLKKPAG